jgi:nitrate reductase NapD
MRLNRRQFLSGQAASPQCHIASLVVQCRPEKLDKTCAAIEELQSTEIPVRDESGKFVVLLDMNSESELLERISEVQSIPGVIIVNLAYNQVDQ